MPNPSLGSIRPATTEAVGATKAPVILNGMRRAVFTRQARDRVVWFAVAIP
jgi:hypothetical protein